MRESGQPDEFALSRKRVRTGIDMRVTADYKLGEAIAKATATEAATGAETLYIALTK